MEPAGESAREADLLHLGAHKNCRVGGETAHGVHEAKRTAQNRIRCQSLVDGVCSIRKKEDRLSE